MTFKVVLPTVKQVAQIALDAAGDPLGARVLEQHAGLPLAIDDERPAYLMHVSSTHRHNSIQFHYMLYFLGRFWHLRTRGSTSLEVGFYDFPPRFENSRAEVQRCFADAVSVYGWTGYKSTPAERSAKFVPVFAQDDYEPPDI